MTKEVYETALYLAHHGIKGQKWGHRRYQNEDGSVTVPEVLRPYMGCDRIEAK